MFFRYVNDVLCLKIIYYLWIKLNLKLYVFIFINPMIVERWPDNRLNSKTEKKYEERALM